MKLAPEVGLIEIFQKLSWLCSLTFSSKVTGGPIYVLQIIKKPTFERESLNHHENKQINPFQKFTVWCVSVAKGLSILACRFGIEGSGRVGPGTSLGQIFKRKLPSKII